MKTLILTIAVLTGITSSMTFASLQTGEEKALIAYMRVQPGTENRFLKAAKNVITESRREAGNIRYQLHQSVSNPQQFVFYELFKSHEDLIIHKNAPHLKAFLKAVLPITLPGQFILEEYCPEGSIE